MRLHRFFTDVKLEPHLNQKNSVIEIQNPELAHQLKKVLRAEIGDSIVIFDGAAHEAIIEIEKIDAWGITAKIISIEKNEKEPTRKTTLYLSILKRENFELAAQKAVEVGISEIVPMICERTIKTGLNIKRLEKIIKEAAEQSGRGIIPAIINPVSFKEAVAGAKDYDKAIIFDMRGKVFDEKKLVGVRKVAIFIGPEGGWSPEELSLASQAGAHIVKMSNLTMRAETAAIVASFLSSSF